MLCLVESEAISSYGPKCLKDLESRPSWASSCSSHDVETCMQMKKAKHHQRPKDSALTCTALLNGLAFASGLAMPGYFPPRRWPSWSYIILHLCSLDFRLPHNISPESIRKCPPAACLQYVDRKRSISPLENYDKPTCMVVMVIMEEGAMVFWPQPQINTNDVADCLLIILA